MTATNFSDYLVQFDGDLKRLHGLMHKHLSADVTLIAEMEEEQYLTGGKRLRAIVALLAGRLCAVPAAAADQTAIAIEFIHTATLLHDDVVDEAPMRRHLPAVARVYGNAAAILAGDFLYSRASQLLAQMNNLLLLQRVADATNKLAEGELLQLINRGKPDMEEKTYYSIIRRKTANLFSVAAAAAAIISERDDAPLSRYGEKLGIAFQLVDDCLDYEGEGATLGKKIGADFSEGKVTLPIILMLARVDAAKRTQLLQEWQQQETADNFAQTIALLNETGALTAVREIAQQNVQEAIVALDCYPDSETKATLIALAKSSINRQN